MSLGEEKKAEIYVFVSDVEKMSKISSIIISSELNKIKFT